MPLKLKLTSDVILNKEFQGSTPGYNPLQVDEYLDRIIKDYRVVEAKVREAKAGRAEFRADRGACVQVPIGKLSFAADAIVENAVAVIKALIKAKPSSAKGVYIQSITLSATMTPGVKVDIREASVKETA